MKKLSSIFLGLIMFCGFAGIFSLAAQEAQNKLPEGVSVKRVELEKASATELRSSKNIQVIFISGIERSGADYLSLAEAMEKGIVKVEETGNVQQLTIENISESAKVFVQAGDIVRGGRQDRTLQTDLILPPKSGKLPLPSFCVEQSRWQKRGGESDSSFGANSNILSSRSQKRAANFSFNQGDVWNEVAEQQDKLSENVSKLSGKNIDVRSKESQTSLELTMDNPDLKKIIEDYQKEIASPPKGALGYFYAINGEFCGGDLYANPALFASLWPKISKALVVEAIAEHGRYEKGMSLSKEGAAKILAQFAKDKSTDSLVEPITVVSQFKKESILRMDSYELVGKQEALWVHSAIIDNPGKHQQQVINPVGDAFVQEMPPVVPSIPLDPVWRSTIIDHLEFEEVNISVALEAIQKMANAKLPKDKTVDIKYVGDSKNPPNITIVADTLQLSEILKYISSASGLRLKIEARSAVLSSKQTEAQAN